MSKRNPTYYEILGLKPNAKHTEVGLAFNRKMAARRREDAPPDLKGDTVLKEAFEVLSDLDRRAEYDARLRAEALKPAFGRHHTAYAALFVIAVGAGLYWHLRPTLAPETVEATGPGKSRHEILSAAIPAVGRLQTVELSGQAQHAGVAFAVEEGVAVTSCQGLSPTAQLSVKLEPREIPARVTLSDEELGLCKLALPGGGGWPLSVSAVPAKPGDTVYTTDLGAKGEVMIRQATVHAVTPSGKAAIVEVSVPLPPQHAGAPLLDIYGRVVAVANMPPGSKGTFVAIPPEWGETPKPPPAPAKVEEPSEDPAKSEGIDDLGRTPEMRRRQEELATRVSPEQRKRIERAYTPPQSVKDL
jgi:hypothetical protein